MTDHEVLQAILSQLQSLNERTGRLEVLLENDIPHEIHTIAEQHTTINEKLDTLAQGVETADETKGRVATLEHIVQSHASDLEEIKQKIG